MLSIAAPSPCYCVYSSSAPLDPGSWSWKCRRKGAVKTSFQQCQGFAGQGSRWRSLSPQSWLSLGIFLCNVLPQPVFPLLSKSGSCSLPLQVPLAWRSHSDYVGVWAPCSGCPQTEAIVGKHRHVAIRQLLPQLKAASTKEEPETSRDPAADWTTSLWPCASGSKNHIYTAKGQRLMEKTKMLELQSNWKKFSEVNFTLLCREMESDTLQAKKGMPELCLWSACGYRTQENSLAL